MKRAANAKAIFYRGMFWLLWPLVWSYAPRKVRSRVFVVCGDEFLVVRPYFGNKTWQLPGGGVKKNESLQQAALRELQEEMNIVTAKAQQLIKTTRYYENGLRMEYSLFIVYLDNKAQCRPNREIADWAWVPLSIKDRYLNIALASHVTEAITVATHTTSVIIK